MATERRPLKRRRFTVFAEKHEEESKVEKHLDSCAEDEGMSEQEIVDIVKTIGDGTENEDVAGMKKKRLLVPVSVVNKWETVSDEAIAFTQMAMKASLKKMKNLTREEEAAIEDVMKSVAEMLKTAVAPVQFRHKNYSQLNRLIIEKKMKR